MIVIEFYDDYKAARYCRCFKTDDRIQICRILQKWIVNAMSAFITFGASDSPGINAASSRRSACFVIGGGLMKEIRFARKEDWEFWKRLDQHLSEEEFIFKIERRQAYVLFFDDSPAGLLRYNLFWDNTPFYIMLVVDPQLRGLGLGKALMEFWESEMKSDGYGMLLTSTQVDESAQHFYRKLGYRDCGGLVVDVPGYEQPMELFLVKAV